MRSCSGLGFLCLVAAVCAVAPRAADAGSRPLDFERLALTTGGATVAAGDYVFRDEESWIAFLGQRVSPLELPEIDFRHETVIASVGAPQPSSCYGIDVDAIERARGRTVVVSVAHTAPFSDRCGCSSVPTKPVVAVVVSGPIGAVEFVHEDVLRGCGPCGFISPVDGQVQRQCGFAIP